MEEKLIEITKTLTEQNETVSTMESCTGGALASAITNISGSSLVFNFGAVTYSNEYKIKMGVNANIIEKYSVYSSEVAREMSRAITEYTSSNYGIGITGKLREKDPNNLMGKDNTVYISIYDKNIDKYYEEEVIVTENLRADNKDIVVIKAVEMLYSIIMN
ncbi:MAG: CinA family protein [Bacilli bacterium]